MDGQCSAGLGAAIILNEDGWVLTAAHVVSELADLSDQVSRNNNRPQEEDRIRADALLNRSEKQKQLRALGKPKPSDAQNYAVIWGFPDMKVHQMKSLSYSDIAVGQIANFDPSRVRVYPRFRDQNTTPDTGRSVCRSGYAFNNIKAEWDGESSTFTFPDGLFPIPVFVNEGIVSRFVNIETDDKNQTLPFRSRMFETSSPGLKGQSGGPIFDSDGRIWGIQSDTISYPLGFSPQANGRIEHQFLNVGRGVDAETVCGFLDMEGIAYQT